MRVLLVLALMFAACAPATIIPPQPTGVIIARANGRPDDGGNFVACEAAMLDLPCWDKGGPSWDDLDAHTRALEVAREACR